MNILHDFLKTGLRKKTNPCFLFLCMNLFFIPLLPMFGQKINIAVTSPVEKSITIKASIPKQQPLHILNNLRNGLRSEALYSIRIYKPRSFLPSLLKDKLIKAYNVTYTALWDPFLERFIVETSGGEEYHFTTSEDFLQFFLTLSRFSFSSVNLPNSESWYIKTRVRVRTIKLTPPFTIFRILFPPEETSSNWVRINSKRIIKLP